MEAREKRISRFIRELCNQDANAAAALPGVDQNTQLCRNTLVRQGMIFVAYETRNGNVVVSIHNGAQWEKPENITSGYPRREKESWSMPQLVEGAEGVVWLFYMSRERRILFGHRHLGSTWSRRIDLPGIHHVVPYFDGSFGEDRAPLSVFSVETDTASGSMVVSLESLKEFWDPPTSHLEAPDEFVGPRGNTDFGPGKCENYPLKNSYTIRSITPSAQSGESVLFLDNREVAEVKGLQWTPETAAKEPANPLLRAGENVWESMSLNLVGSTAMFREGKFHLWYTGIEFPGQGELPKFEKLGENAMKYGKVCYAQSDDGIHWEKPHLRMVEYMGNKDNNIVPGLWQGPVFFVDEMEPDPQKRFKGVQQFETCSYCPDLLKFVTSPDGIHWMAVPGVQKFPGARPWSFGGDSFFRDDDDPDPARRWKIYGYCGTGPYRRACAVVYSSDCVNWECYPETPIITPRQVSSPCIHDLIIWKESGLYIGLLQVGDQWHDYHLEMVVSRDGLNFTLVQDGHPFLKRGERGSWDCGSLAGCTPFVHNDELYLYYSGSSRPHNEHTKTLDMWSDPDSYHIHIGLARVGTGRYAGFSLGPDDEIGALISVPITPADEENSNLLLNARIQNGGRIRAALLDAETQKVTPGYSLEECIPVTEGGYSIPILWKNSEQTKSPKKPYRLQIELSGRNTKIFGFAWGK